MKKGAVVVKWLAVLLALLLTAIFWNIWMAVGFGLIALGILLNIDPVFPFGISLLFLFICVLLVLVGQEDAARTVAMWAYCLLAAGVAMQLYHYLQASPDGDDSTNR